LSCEKQTKLLESTFWNIRYFNTWIMYVGITGGKGLAWRHFLSGNWFVLFTRLFKTSKICKNLLNDKIKCLHLFQCFAEIGGNKLLEKFFKDQTIDLSNQTLLPKDINTLGYFILRSVKQWEMLNLSKCNIGDVGCDIFLNMLGNRDIVRIDKVNLSDNGLQTQSMLKLLKMFTLWHTSEAIISEVKYHNEDQFQLFSDEFSLGIDKDLPISVSVNRSYMFAHNVTDVNLFKHLMHLTNINGLYLNNCTYHLETESLNLLHKSNVFNLHIVDGKYDNSFLKAIVKSIKQIFGVFIKNSSLSDKPVSDIASVLVSKGSCNINRTRGWMVVGNNKIMGNINMPCEKNSIPKIVDLLMHTGSLRSDMFV